MRKQVRQFINQCPVCQKLRETKIALKVHPFTTASYSPMETINVDTIGPVTKDSFGNEFILVIIDCFSRWIELYPMPDTSALAASRGLLQFVGRFGVPGVIRSDRGSQFVNNLIADLCKLLVTDQQLSIAYSKEENGIVERSNKEVMRHIRAIIFDRRIIEHWSMDQLPLVMRILNSEEKTNTGVSPAELLFGNAVDLGRRLLREPIARIEGSTQDLTDYMEKMLAQQAALIDVAQQTQNNHDTHHMSSFDTEFTEFPINSYVLVNPPEGKRPKLATRKKGPFQIVNHIGSKYTLQDLLTGKNFDIHISNLVPFNYDSTRTNPTDVAAHDAEEFVIDHIIAHRGDKTRRKTMEFLVKWAGFSDDANSWEPFCNLRDTDQLLDYLRDNRLRSLIPQRHK
jgi:transposase InsO family protein